MDHTADVADIKAILVAAGVSLVGPCGAFAITQRVAWRLRGEGAGLLHKPDGNNCIGYAVDIVAYPDGTIFDVLANSGGDEGPGGPIPGTGNVPAWNPVGMVDPARWRAPFPSDVVGPAPTPDPPPLPPAVDVTAALAAVRSDLAAISQQVRELSAAMESVLTMVASLDVPTKFAGTVAIRYLGNAPVTLTATP